MSDSAAETEPISDVHREHLVSARENASRDYDKALLTLSAGALGVSIAFVHSIAPHPKDTFLLGVSWTLFALSLVCVVVSLLTSQFELLGNIRSYDADPTTASSPESDSGQFSSATTWLNLASGASFLIGVGFLIVFAFLNLKGV